MTVTVAKEAGFCFGVKRATDFVEKRLSEGAKVYIIGQLIHNRIYNEQLASRGAEIISVSDVRKIAESGREAHIIIRTHGIPKDEEQNLRAIEKEYPNITVEDMTCPFVKKIHRIADENTNVDTTLAVVGTPTHPEVLSILSYAKGDSVVFDSAESIDEYAKNDKNHEKTVVLVAQTTSNTILWKNCEKKFKKLYTNANVFDTICNVTDNRQSEVKSLAMRSDGMIVIGGRESSNTHKLYEIASKHCKRCVLVERADEIDKKYFDGCTNIGITAGASTPSGIIEEVYKTMAEFENFEELLEASFKTLNTGDTVVGTVMSVSNNEIRLDLGAKATGVITYDQITDEPGADLNAMFKVGDQVEGFVIKVSDIDGIAVLSKKRVDSDKNWKYIVEAKENDTILEGKVVEAVKGGVLIVLNGVRVFVPASLTGVPKGGDLTTLVGTTQRVKIVDINDQRHRAYASIRAVLREERKAVEDAFWAAIEEGKHYQGTVKNLATYGAFVDLGGVDGMVHNSELSWKHIKHPSQVVKVGDVIDVWVKSFDKETGKISLGYKTDDMNSWFVFKNKYAVGDVATVKIVSFTPFGAFAEIVPGTDGLIHISQISKTKIAQPSDVLEIGQEVEVKITDIDEEKEKVSLSIRALLEEAEAPATEEVAADAE
ncbi:MAG: bifunctional 4-hydroxy-3-methylbut-2-enyl diphosphate reductase/30S ribosomal protein S1 [Clostridia bacterium]|nr:bifunctional 4-hydroxy-3-methylbut-2-enyl diphosphate reductase/30S ribosomal protein S1 [Clostridia bacterium]